MEGAGARRTRRSGLAGLVQQHWAHGRAVWVWDAHLWAATQRGKRRMRQASGEAVAVAVAVAATCRFGRTHSLLVAPGSFESEAANNAVALVVFLHAYVL